MRWKRFKKEWGLVDEEDEEDEEEEDEGSVERGIIVLFEKQVHLQKESGAGLWLVSWYREIHIWRGRVDGTLETHMS